MTAVSFTQVNSLNKLTNVVNGASQSTQSADFSEVLKANSGKPNGLEVQGVEAGKVDTAKTDNTSRADKEKVDNTSKSDKADDSEKDFDAAAKETKDQTETATQDSDTKAEDEIVEIPQEIVEAAAQAMIAVAEILKVEVADVETAVDNLGLTEIAVLDESKIQDIALEVAGVENPVELMTDETLYSDVKAVGEAVADIVEEIDLPKEDVKDIITNFEVNVEETEANEGLEEINIKPAEESADKDDASHDNSSAGMNLTQTIVDNIKAAATEVSTETEVYSNDMNEIYEQVGESLKLNLTEEVTEMEINLHPASLGNVRIQIAAKDGVITANFTTQNETVKAALETQIIQLKENMNEQGIKVEAIEVNVSAHAFEENLSKEGDSSNGGETQNSRKRRSINLNEIDENDDNIVVEDEIRIAREMMMANGTTVDYMA